MQRREDRTTTTTTKIKKKTTKKWQLWVRLARWRLAGRQFENKGSVPRKNSDNGSTMPTLMLIGRNGGGSSACREMKVEARMFVCVCVGVGVSDGDASSSCCITRCHVP